MMWMSYTMDGNRQEGKWLVVERKNLKWVKANSALEKITLTNSHGNWDDYEITFTITMIV
jgi:hypothetical protein